MAEPLKLNLPANPGSLNDFSARVGIDPTAIESATRYSDVLQAYREQLAAERGLGPEDLHALGSRVLNPNQGLDG